MMISGVVSFFVVFIVFLYMVLVICRCGLFRCEFSFVFSIGLVCLVICVMIFIVLIGYLFFVVLLESIIVLVLFMIVFVMLFVFV